MLRGARKKLFEQRDDIRARIMKRKEESKKARSELKYSSVAIINKEIKKLEDQQKTTTMSLTAEKVLIKDIEALKVQRKQLEAFDRKGMGSQSDDNKMRELRDEIGSLSVAIKDLEAKQATDEIKIKEIKAELSDAQTMQDQYNARDAIRGQIDAKWESVRPVF